MTSVVTKYARLPLALHRFEDRGRRAPHLVQQVDHRLGRELPFGKVHHGEVHEGVVVAYQCHEAVELVQRRSRVGHVAYPHRRAQALGDRRAEHLRLGLFQLGARQVVHVDVGAAGYQLVHLREVVRGRIARLGLDLLHSYRLLLACGRVAARPARTSRV